MDRFTSKYILDIDKGHMCFGTEKGWFERERYHHFFWMREDGNWDSRTTFEFKQINNADSSFKVNKL